MPTEDCKFRYKPSLDSIEKFLKQTISKTLAQLFKYQKVFLTKASEAKDYRDDKRKKTFTLAGMKEELDFTVLQMNDTLLNTFYKPLALLAIIEPMRFYNKEGDVFERDIKELLSQREFQLVVQEYHEMQRDLRVWKVLIPQHVDCGIMIIQTSEVKTKMYEAIERNIEKLTKRCEETFLKTVEHIEKLYEETWEAMKPKNKDIETYIQLHDYVSGPQYQKALEEIKDLVTVVQSLFEILEELLVHMSEELLIRYLQVKISSVELKKTSDKLMHTLQGNIAKYAENLGKEKVQLEKEFEKYKTAFDSFENYDNMAKYFVKLESDRLLAQDFLGLVERMRKMNVYRKKLGLDEADSGEMEEYYVFWDYCENLFFVRKIVGLLFLSLNRVSKCGRLALLQISPWKT